jgi:hypothetical protein
MLSLDSLTLPHSKRLGVARPHHADLMHNTYRSTATCRRFYAVWSGAMDVLLGAVQCQGA